MNDRILRNLMRLATVLLVGSMTVSMLSEVGKVFAESGPAIEDAALSVLPRLLALASVWVAGSWMLLGLRSQAEDLGDEVRVAKREANLRFLLCLMMTLSVVAFLMTFLQTTLDISEADSLFNGYVTLVLRAAVMIAAVVFVVSLWRNAFKSRNTETAASKRGIEQ